jgi:hypothetical protein
VDYFLLSVNDQQVLSIQFDPNNGSSSEVTLPNGKTMHWVSCESPDDLFGWTFVSIELLNDNGVLKSVVKFNGFEKNLEFNYLPIFEKVNLQLCNDQSDFTQFCNM